MAWIKFEKDLQTDPRVLRIARLIESRWLLFDAPKCPSNEQYDPCNASPLPAVTLVCGCLARLWCLADTHVGEDDILRLSISEIDAFIGLPGFCKLMPEDWLIDHGESVELPGFHIHNGTLAKTRAVTQKRVEKHRKRTTSSLHPVTHEALPDQDQTRPDLDRIKPLTEGSRKNGAHHERIDDSPIVETLPILGGSFEVHQSLVAELEPLCPAVDIPVTLREMKLWLVGNPSRMKTRKGVRRFISGWLTREQQKWDATQGRH